MPDVDFAILNKNERQYQLGNVVLKVHTLAPTHNKIALSTAKTASDDMLPLALPSIFPRQSACI